MRFAFAFTIGLTLAACSSTAPSSSLDGGDAGPNDGGNTVSDGGDAGAGCNGGCGAALQCVASSCVPYSCADGGSCPTGLGLVCQNDLCSSPSGCPTCLPNQACVSGACVSATACGPQESVCGETSASFCANLNQDNHDCGACGRACSSGQDCARGQCQTSCLEGEVACAFDGGALCAEIQTDNQNCGGCGNACPTGKLCSGGQCGTSCAPPTQGTCGSGTQAYCADLQNSPFDCGSCGVQCPTEQYCSEGQCAARCEGLTDQLCGGICVDLQSDLENCGACGVACPAGKVCYGSACTATCGPPETTCVIAGQNVCANLLEDTRNCGACGNACAAGQVCSAGVCASSCVGASGTLCNGVCVHLASDNFNCGACGASCPSGQYCNGIGSCAASCESGDDLCGSGTAAACVSLQGDADNCGACGHVCATNLQCVAGTCVVGDGGMSLIDGGTDGGNTGPLGCDAGCQPGFACLGNVCASQTCPGSNCPEGFACLDGGCIAPGCAEVTCPVNQGCGNGSCYPESCGSSSCNGGLCFLGSCVSADCAGIVCDAGMVCSGGACAPGCASCSVPELCINDACVPGCAIGAASYSAGTINPQNSCESCQPSANPAGWTELTGNTCAGPSNYCETGVCTELCTIAGTVYQNGAVNSQNACQVCEVAQNPLGWSAVTNNQTCGTQSGYYCESGECTQGCYINLVFVPQGGAESGDACQVCNTNLSTTGFSPASNGTSCGGNNGCYNGHCTAGCTVDGGFFENGIVDPIPGQGCGVCNVNTSLTSWAPFTGPVPGGGGGCATTTEVCDQGNCTVGCYLDGGFVDAGTVGLSLVCCAPTTSTSSWSSLFPATSYDLMSGVSTQGIAVGDVDNKNGVDLVAADSTGNIEVFLGQGNGSFSTTPIVSGGGGLHAYAIVLGDFNGDGNLDIAGNYGSDLNIFLGNGDGTFKAGPANGNPFGTVAGAGYLLGPSSPLDVVGTDNSGRLTVASINGGALTFNQAVITEPIVNADPNDAVAIGDLTGDGFPEVAFPPTTGGIAEFHNNATSPLVTTPVVYGTEKYSALVEAPYAGHQYQSGLPILDVLAAAQDPGTNALRLDLYVNDGGGGLTLSHTTFTSVTGQSATVLVSADFNHDGYLDVAARTTAFSSAVDVFLGDGDGGFNLQGQITTLTADPSDFAETPLAYNLPALIGTTWLGSTYSIVVMQELNCH